MTGSNSAFDVFTSPTASQSLATSNLESMKLLIDQINASGEKASRLLTSAFTGAATNGKSFNDTLTTIGQSLEKLAVRSAANALGQGLAASLSGLFTSSLGASSVTPFADGGVIASPTYFANGASAGLMGERGAEAVMPLARGSDGRLGVVAPNGGAAPVAVTVNIHAQNVDSFRRSETQIAGALARAVTRGQRTL